MDLDMRYLTTNRIPVEIVKQRTTFRDVEAVLFRKGFTQGPRNQAGWLFVNSDSHRKVWLVGRLPYVTDIWIAPADSYLWERVAIESI